MSASAMSSSGSPHVHFCKTRDGVSIAYAASGSGVPFVRAPNWMNHVELDVQSPVWRSWIEEINRRHTLVRYDARGCGLSDGVEPSPDFAVNQADLEAVVDAAGLQRFVLFGACQGAAIAIEYAARHPDRVSHLVLVGPYMQGVYKRKASDFARQEAEALVNLVEVGWGRKNSAFRRLFSTLFIPDSKPEQLESFDELQRKTVTPQRAACLLRSFYHVDVLNCAGKVSCPTIVFHATGDGRIPFEEGRRTASAIPGAVFVPLESRNHILLDHQPAWERFFVELDAFMQRHPAQDAKRAMPRFEGLTPAEDRLLELLAAGINNAQIARRLRISEKTVRNHINHIFSKLSVQDRSEAIVLARDAGYGKRGL
jgi:pimeloyl-ACP methyl ester carboxylesterase/DNA-binding CsgD family transcriptional regulator